MNILWTTTPSPKTQESHLYNEHHIGGIISSLTDTPYHITIWNGIQHIIIIYRTPETNRSSIKITLSSYTILIYLYIIFIYVISFHIIFYIIWNDLPTMNRYNENKHTLSSHHERNKQQQYNHLLSRHNTHLIWRIIKNIQ